MTSPSISADAPTAPASDLEAPDPSGSIGRFVVEGMLGRGGMGVVMAARDPELGRRVAIKLLVGDPDHERLDREAQAMAKLSHPNVVTVYEVGTCDGRRFIAMELVEGQTLKAWLAEKLHSTREVVAMFEQAGRGLEAAHLAGLVHRDFKPENVLVGSDGRARVGDFGLVSGRAHGDRGGEEDVTATGSIMGTPAYMSPEQHAGEIADARSDQFAFAVALHEALHGARPFPGTTIAELRNSMLAGKRVPARRPVPAWLTDVVERALAIDPGARWPSMTALLEALRRDPAARRRRIAVGVALVGLAGLAGWALLRPSSASDPCAGAADRVHDAWTPARRQAITSALAAGNPTVAAFVTDRLDRAATALGDARIDACRATHTRGEQSEALLDARMRCLDGHLAAFRSMTELLAHPAPKLIDAATGAVARLGDLDDCAAVVELSALPLEPPDTTVRAAVDALHARMMELAATTTLIEPKDALARSEALLVEARRLGYCPELAVALLQRGQAISQSAADKTGLANAMSLMRDAARMADGCRADRARANALIALVQALEHADAPAAERHDAIDATVAAVRRVDSTSLRIQLLFLESSSFATDGKMDMAIALGETALALENLTPEGPDIAELESLAIVHLRNGTVDAGEGFAKRAHELLVARVGKDHPAIAQLNQILASFRAARGDQEGTLPLLEDALRIQRARFGPEHRQVLITEANIGAALVTTHHFAEGRERLEKALPVVKRVFGEQHQLVGDMLGNLVVALRGAKERQTALAYGHQAVELWAHTAGPDHPKTARARANLAAVEADLKRWPEALADGRAALAIYERTMSPTAPSVAHVLLTIGDVEIELHDAKRALVDLDRAAAIYTKLGDRDGLAETDLSRADAHVALGEMAAARALAQAIVDHPADDDSRDLAARWLAKHP